MATMERTAGLVHSRVDGPCQPVAVARTDQGQLSPTGQRGHRSQQGEGRAGGGTRDAGRSARRARSRGRGEARRRPSAAQARPRRGERREPSRTPNPQTPPASHGDHRSVGGVALAQDARVARKRAQASSTQSTKSPSDPPPHTHSGPLLNKYTTIMNNIADLALVPYRAVLPTG